MERGLQVFDKRGPLWLPRRYVGVGDDDANELSELPALKGKVGWGVRDLKLTQSRYAVRADRTQRLQYGEGYGVFEDSYLYKFDVHQPPVNIPAFSCDRSTCGSKASMVSIPEAKRVPHVWSLFPPFR